MNTNVQASAAALCIIVLSFDRTNLTRTLKEIEHQDYPNKRIIVLHSWPLTGAIEPGDIEGVRYLPLEADDICGCISEVLFSEDADYVFLWRENQWSHCSRLSHQIVDMKRKYKQVSVLLHHLLADTVHSQVLVSPRCLNFCSSVWETSYLRTLGAPGVELATGKSYELYSIVQGSVAPLNAPYLFIQLYEGVVVDRVTDDYWFSATPLRDEIGEKICSYLKGDDIKSSLSTYLTGTAVKAHFSYSYMLGGTVL